MPTRIEARGLTFDVHDGGPAGGEPVLLLHGFPQDSREWDLVAPRLHAAGLRTVALDQRGYSPGARPPAVADYRIGECVADALAVLDALGLSTVHVVGHDWGASVAWRLAAEHPDRVRTLTAVSVPHPRALGQALRASRLQQARSAYILLFRRRGLAERVLLARDGAVLRWMLRPCGRERAAGYARAMREPGRLTGALNWYRAIAAGDASVDPVTVPTAYVWSDGDVAVTRAAAERCAAQVRGDFRFVRLRGVTHWIPDQSPEPLAEAILARIR